ncbi:unnamed protein product [Rotaria sp. Silwood1]|nr:unnamed protein product [Rotaria sp. Silwood1]
MAVIMDKKNSKPTASDASSATKVKAAMSKNATQLQPVRRMLENFLLIWLDADFDESKDDYKKFMQHLRDIFAIVATFTDVDECFDFLTDIHNEKVFLIVSDAIGQHIIGEIHECSQLTSIYILCHNQSIPEEWFKTMPKVKGVYTQIEPICDALQIDSKNCDRTMISISFNGIDPLFKYTQLLKEALLDIEDDDAKSIKEFVEFCRHHSDASKKQLKKIVEEYCNHSPIWWYTGPYFIYSMLNYGLRQMDIDIILKMTFFIRHLHNHIAQLYRQQQGNMPINFQTFRGQVTTITLFEDLANEILYEIFEYLDIYHVYQGFIYLNKRLQNLLFHSTFPIKINISTMSKSNFNYYHGNIILPNQHRINSLRLSNPFTVDIIFSPPRILSKFICLEILILDNIKAQYLNRIFNHLILLPKLHSLVLSLIEYVQYPNEEQLLPITFDKYQHSPIEHFIINSRIRFDSFHILLICLPQLRRLSIDCLVKCAYTNLELNTNFLEHLKYVSLKLDYVDFNQLEKIIKIFFRYVEILCLTIAYDESYLDTKQWEQLILSFMPNLHIFDINHDSSARKNPLIYHNSINQFTSSFWIEKQWFFTHQHDYEGRLDCGIFHSTNPYRRKDYIFYWEMVNEHCPHVQEMNLNSVKHVYICCKRIANNTLKYFPNATQLTIKYYFNISADTLNRIIPLKQITILIIDLYTFSFEQLTNLLYFLPNIHTLKSNFINYNENNLLNDIFEYISKTNKIKNLDIKSLCTLDLIKLIMNLFPKLEYLKTGIYRKEFKEIIQYILSKNNNNTCHLCLLCITEIPKICLTEMDVLIEVEHLLNQYFIKYINRDLYLWW